jgi:large subunit ribosomal protein L46
LLPVPISCIHRSLATEVDPAPSESDPLLPKRDTKPLIHAGVVLNRAPLLTQTPTAFESAYYAYHARIRRALHNPFPYDFYFKQGSLLENKFALEERTRERVAFGESFGGEEGEQTSSSGGEEGEEQTELAGEDKAEIDGETPLPREHEADIKGDLKSLDRKGDRNLYLLLQEKESDAWRFPQGGLEKGELLHQVGCNIIFVRRFRISLLAGCPARSIRAVR